MNNLRLNPKTAIAKRAPRSATGKAVFGLNGHWAAPTNGATTQESPSRERTMKAINGRIMVNSRYRVQMAVATGFDILKIQTFNPKRSGREKPES